MRKAKYQVTRTMNKGRVKTTTHNTQEAAFKNAKRSLSGYGTAEITKVKVTPKKKVRAKRRRSKK